jgi:hypothetical protein
VGARTFNYTVSGERIFRCCLRLTVNQVRPSICSSGAYSGLPARLRAFAPSCDVFRMKGATFYTGVLFRIRPFPACNRERRMNVRKTRLPAMAEIVAKRELGAVCI